MVCICILIGILFALSRPAAMRFSGDIEPFLSRDKTCAINAFFILLVLFRHAMMAYHYPMHRIIALEYFLNQKVMGQLLVTTFFFFSGYGVMMSLVKKKDDYLKSFLRCRFLSLYMRYAILVAVYALLGAWAPGATYDLFTLLQAFCAFNSIGNQEWFIFMTLSLYLMLFVAFRVCGLQRGGRSICLVCIFLLLLLAVLYYWGGKFGGWLDTAMCFPFGMLFCLYREKIAVVLRKSPLPVIVIAIALIASGVFIYRGSATLFETFAYLAYVIRNVGSVVFATGIAIGMCGITLRRVHPLLKWCGGPALFYLYMTENLFCIIPVCWKWSWIQTNTLAYLAFVFIGTFLCAYILIPVFKRLDAILVPAKKKSPSAAL